MVSIANLQRRNAATAAASAWAERTGRPSLVVVDNEEASYRRRLGAAIVEVRGIRGISAAKLAELVSRSEAAISRWETGKATPSAFDLHRIADALNVPADLLVFPPETRVSPIAQRLLEGAEVAAMRAEIEAVRPELQRDAERQPGDAHPPGKPASTAQ